MASKKLNITLQDELVERMDAFTQRNSMSRSGLIATAVTQYLNSVEAMPNVNKILALMGSLAKRAAHGEINSEDYERELQELERAQALLEKR